MKSSRLLSIGLAGCLLAAATVAIAQVYPVPQVVQIGANDLFQDITNGVPSANSVYASSGLLGNYGPTLGGNNPENWLIGGDATTNLFQRATSGSSVTTTVTYGGPDRWAYWSGTSTAMTVSQDTTAADLPAIGYKAGFKMARTSGQTGVVQVCMAQEVESVNAYVMAGQTAEVDFHAVTGGNFSPASGNLTVYVISGTGSDEGMQKLSWGLNAGGGGSTAWAGQVNTGVVVPTGAAGSTGRYTIAAPVPATATEIGVAICFTPVGTAGTNDFVTLSGIQLTRNSALTALAGTAGVALPVNDNRAKAFSRRSQALETALQQRYYYQITEGAAITPRAACHVTTANSVMQCAVQYPVPMRIAPTATYTAGFAGFTTTAETTATNCSALAIDSTVVFVNSPLFGLAQCTLTSSTIAVGLTMTLVDNSGAGAMKYSAEF